MQWDQTVTAKKMTAWMPLRSLAQVWQSVIVLFKLRIVTLLLLSAYGGAVLGQIATGATSLRAWLILTVAGTLSAAGASGINQYLERDQDAKMRRTAKRPLVLGDIEQPQVVLWLGTGMVLLAVFLATLINGATAVFIALGAIIYVGVYTIWLKPRTTLNIVIGGAAGSCAVISGGAAMGAWQNTAVLLLALLIFVWTPVHFWALALAYRHDYQQASYPMLPARVAAPTAARWTALHTLLTVACGLALGLIPQFDWLFILPISLISVMLLHRTWRLLQAPAKAPALALFHASNSYLAAVLLVILLVPIWR